MHYGIVLTAAKRYALVHDSSTAVGGHIVQILEVRALLTLQSPDASEAAPCIRRGYTVF